MGSVNSPVQNVAEGRMPVLEPAVGDHVEVQPKGIHMQGRIGRVDAVLSHSPPRYQVRWQSGRWSIISATDAALRVLPLRKRAPRRRTTTTGVASPAPRAR